MRPEQQRRRRDQRATMESHPSATERRHPQAHSSYSAEPLYPYEGLYVDQLSAWRRAFTFVEQSGGRFWLADLHRVEGRIALAALDRERAETCFLKAIEIAREQEAPLLQLRAATDLAHLWRDTGSPADPRALPEPILAAIDGGGERNRCQQRARCWRRSGDWG
jgi:hypothetical protein